MFKILVIDDEKLHRIGLMKAIAALYPEDIILEAENGEKALEIMGLMKCDILITDIRMPGIDGIQLAKQIRKEYPESAVVILSGYGEFEYAKEAIKYGVLEYLLKPVDIEEMRECLDKVRMEISRGRDAKKDHEQMRTQLRETEPIFVEYLMRSFVRGDNPENKERVREIFPLEHSGYLFLCQIEQEDDGFWDRQEFRLTIKQYIRNASSYSFPAEENLYAVLVMDAEKGNQHFFEGMKEALKKSLPGLRFSFYISGCKNNLCEKAEEAYREAMMVWKYRFYELGDFYDYDCMKDHMEGEITSDFGAADLLEENIRKNNTVLAYTLIKEYVEKICVTRLPDPEILCRTIMLLLFQTVKTLEPVIGENIRQKADGMLEKINRAGTKRELLRLVSKLLEELGNNTYFQKEVRGTELLEHCREYLETHYMDEVTLETTAQKYYFTASYFSTIFKNYFGKSFSVYLMELRMEEARKFLADGKYKVKDVAAKVGYRDANYFIRAYKKFFGITPEEYRKRKAQEKQL